MRRVRARRSGAPGHSTSRDSPNTRTPHPRILLATHGPEAIGQVYRVLYHIHRRFKKKK